MLEAGALLYFSICCKRPRGLGIKGVEGVWKSAFLAPDDTSSKHLQLHIILCDLLTWVNTNNIIFFYATDREAHEHLFPLIQMVDNNWEVGLLVSSATSTWCTQSFFSPFSGFGFGFFVVYFFGVCVWLFGLFTCFFFFILGKPHKAEKNKPKLSANHKVPVCKEKETKAQQCVRNPSLEKRQNFPRKTV